MKKILKAICKKIKIRTLIMLIVLLAFNSYAWFIYSNKVSAGMSVHVTSWNVAFDVGEETAVTNMQINVDRVYPGMEDFSRIITANNSGEAIAIISYKINSVRILDNTYQVDQNTTSEDLIDMLANDFPFTITVTISNPVMQAQNGTSNIEVFMRLAV